MNYFKFFSRLSGRSININKRQDQRVIDETHRKSKHFSEVSLDKLEFSALDDLPEDKNVELTFQLSCDPVQDNSVPPPIFPSLPHTNDSCKPITGQMTRHQIINLFSTHSDRGR
jgi:hypothetical protein